MRCALMPMEKTKIKMIAACAILCGLFSSSFLKTKDNPIPKPIARMTINGN
jgi:hypothetical protein